MKIINNKIQVIGNITKNTTKTKNNELHITGMVSNTTKDLQEETITEEALKSMKTQIVGLNLHIDHKNEFNGAIGTITDSWIKNNNLYLQAKILPEYSEMIKDRLEFGMNYGFSIGAKVTDYSDDYSQIKGIKMLEVSLVAIPANHDTFGTVQISKDYVVANCLTGACNLLKQKKLEGENMTNNNTEKPIKDNDEGKETPITREEVEKLLNEGINELIPVITEDIVKQMQSRIDTVVQDSLTSINEEISTLKTRVDKLDNTDEEEDTTKSDDEEEDDDDLVKSFNRDEISQIISKAIDDSLLKNTNSKPSFKSDNLNKNIDSSKQDKLYPNDVPAKGLTIEEIAQKQAETQTSAVNSMIADVF